MCHKKSCIAAEPRGRGDGANWNARISGWTFPISALMNAPVFDCGQSQDEYKERVCSQWIPPRSTAGFSLVTSQCDTSMGRPQTAPMRREPLVVVPRCSAKKVMLQVAPFTVNTTGFFGFKTWNQQLPFDAAVFLYCVFHIRCCVVANLTRRLAEAP